MKNRIGIAAVLLAGAAQASPLSGRAGISRTTLAEAIGIALGSVPGEAVRAQIEVEDGRAEIEVTVVSRGKTVTVEVDGETGRVLEVEPAEEEKDRP